ncbi:MAG TPA: hypothetical protein VJH97_00205 [Candidatus Nanoarchaeia archaeon]|nr:hypothetical protein [Candidatus Nanoarchaeia archaeon]
MPAIKLKPRKTGFFTKVLLGLPIVLSLSLIGYIQYSKQTARLEGIFLSPQSDTLLIALLVFTVGYVLFVSLMFSDEIKSFFARHVRK